MNPIKTWSILFNAKENMKYSWFFGPPNLRHCRVTNWNKKNFSFSGHTYKPKEISFIIRKLRKFDFCEQKLAKWFRDECKLSSNLVKLIQTNLGFEEELEKFEGSFEWDEIVDI
jgi:hypothetical protein